MKYFGKLGDIDNKLLTLAVQKGYLSKISENANDVNAPAKMKHLGVEVESVNSSSDADYSELVEVVAHCQNGEVRSAAGTVMGKSAARRSSESTPTRSKSTRTTSARFSCATRTPPAWSA